MINCTPRGICSWNFVLDGGGHHATVEFNWVGEQGAITADGVAYAVQKHGVWSGAWTLVHRGEEIVRAQKSSAFTRTFELEDASGELTLRAESPFGRAFRLEQFGTIAARIYPHHPFTRRTWIDVTATQTYFATIAFSFWLAVITWRRAANNSS